jgi:hypothetical protein
MYAGDRQAMMNFQGSQRQVFDNEQRSSLGLQQNFGDNRMMYEYVAAANQTQRVQGHYPSVQQLQYAPRVSNHLPPRHNAASTPTNTLHPCRPEEERVMVVRQALFSGRVNGQEPTNHTESASVMNLSNSESDGSSEYDEASFDLSAEYTYSDEEPAANLDCMNSLFFATAKDQDGGDMGLIKCNRVGPSASELQLNIKLPSRYMNHLAPSETKVEGYMDQIVANGSNKLDGAMDKWICEGPSPLDKKFDFNYGSQYAALEAQDVERDPYRQFREGIVVPQLYESLFSEGSSDDEDGSEADYGDRGIFPTASGHPDIQHQLPPQVSLGLHNLPEPRQLQSLPSQIFIGLEEVPTMVETSEEEPEMVTSIELSIAGSEASHGLPEDHKIIPSRSLRSLVPPPPPPPRPPMGARGFMHAREQYNGPIRNSPRSTNAPFSVPFVESMQLVPAAAAPMQNRLPEREVSKRPTSKPTLRTTRTEDLDCSSVLALHPNDFIGNKESEDCSDGRTEESAGVPLRRADVDHRQPNSSPVQSSSLTGRESTLGGAEEATMPSQTVDEHREDLIGEYPSFDEPPKLRPRPRSTTAKTMFGVATVSGRSGQAVVAKNTQPRQVRPVVLPPSKDMRSKISELKTKLDVSDRKLSEASSLIDAPVLYDENNQSTPSVSVGDELMGASSTTQVSGAANQSNDDANKLTEALPKGGQEKTLTKLDENNVSSDVMSSNTRVPVGPNDHGTDATGDELMEQSPSKENVSECDNGSSVNELSDTSIDNCDSFVSCPPASSRDEFICTQPMHSEVTNRGHGNIVLEETNSKLNVQNGARRSTADNNPTKINRNTASGVPSALAAAAFIATMVDTASREQQTRSSQVENSPHHYEVDEVPDLEDLDFQSCDEHEPAIDAGRGVAALMRTRW